MTSSKDLSNCSRKRAKHLSQPLPNIVLVALCVNTSAKQIAMHSYAIFTPNSILSELIWRAEALAS